MGSIYLRKWRARCCAFDWLMRLCKSLRNGAPLVVSALSQSWGQRLAGRAEEREGATMKAGVQLETRSKTVCHRGPNPKTRFIRHKRKIWLANFGWTPCSTNSLTQRGSHRHSLRLRKVSLGMGHPMHVTTSRDLNKATNTNHRATPGAIHGMDPSHFLPVH